MKCICGIVETRFCWLKFNMLMLILGSLLVHTFARTSEELLLSRPRIIRYNSPRDLLNCDGNFSSLWSQFRASVVGNAEAGFPIDPVLYNEARRIALLHAEDALIGGIKFSYVVAKSYPVSVLHDFCLHGYVAALFILFRHDYNVDHLFHIHELLGWRERPLDFSESSEWPTLWRMMPLHFEEAKKLGDASWSMALESWGDDSTQVMPSFDFTAVKHALRKWFHDVQVLPQRWLRRHSGEATKLRLLRSFRRHVRPLGVWVLGHHLGSSMEPYTMLQRALHVGIGLNLQASFCGQRHPKSGLVCEEFGFCDEDKGLKKWFQRYESRWLGEYEWMPHRWDEALEKLATVIASSKFMSTSDLVVCGGPAWFCAMLRTVWSVPMLLYFAWPIASLVPKAFKSQIFSLIQSLGHTLSPPTVIVVANWVLAAQFAIQVHMEVPVQRPHGLYMNQTYMPIPTADGFPRVMVTRFAQWALNSAVAMHEMIWSFFEQVRRETGHRYPFELVFISELLRGADPKIPIKYSEFAKFHSCVFWPWDVMMLLFNELYTMAMPLLVPARRWMYHLMFHSLEHTDMNWWHLRGASVGGMLPYASKLPFPLPHLPWFNPGGSLREVAYWYEQTDFIQFPHVTYFNSLPDMFDRIQTLDVATIRKGMQEFNQVTLQESLAFYREAAVELLHEVG